MNQLFITLCTVGDQLLGLHVAPGDLSLLQLTARCLVVFLWGIVIVRFGDRRLLGRNAGFDVLLLVILGSVLSRAINGQAPFFRTLGVSAALVLFHHLLAVATSRWSWLSRVVKGNPRLLVVDGKILNEELRRARVTLDDLEENLRLNGNVAHAQQVVEARLERNGTVSVVKKQG